MTDDVIRFGKCGTGVIYIRSRDEVVAIKGDTDREFTTLFLASGQTLCAKREVHHVAAKLGFLESREDED